MDHNLNIPRYVEPKAGEAVPTVEEAMQKLRESAQAAFEAEDKLEADVIECVLGLGPNLFVTRERAQSYLTDAHIARVVAAYRDFVDVPGFARVVAVADIRVKDVNLSIPLYVAPTPVAEHTRAGYAVSGEGGLQNALADWM